MENKAGKSILSGIEVICENVENNPCCIHGPTLLYTRLTNGSRKFFACSACRNRKNCSYFLWADEKDKNKNQDIWDQQRKLYVQQIDHVKAYFNLKKVQETKCNKRLYCHTCEILTLSDKEHSGHSFKRNITDNELKCPSELLLPLENPKKEAQYLFSKKSVETMVNILEDLNIKNVVCVGTPRIHEFINCEHPKMKSLMLDLDNRYYSFFGPEQFCWYNMFNNHFFLPDAKKTFKKFLTMDSGRNFAIIMDPPFGGRVEPLSHTIKCILEMHEKLNGINNAVSVFWIFPYFMEPQILNRLPEFSMLHYKVDYDNHPLFQNVKGKKQGSPVRIFTNVDQRLIKLPATEGYKYCKLCRLWVSKENKHCKFCESCTSKDGRTYIHCKICNRCVKPTWQHCSVCSICIQPKLHNCSTKLIFNKKCFFCNKRGHKRKHCTEVPEDNVNKM